MAAKLSAWQVQQLLESTSTLCEYNRRARKLLQRLPIPSAMNRFGERCGGLAIAIESSLAFRKELLSPDPARPTPVVFQLVCTGCSGNAPPTLNREDDTAADTQGHFAHLEEIEALVVRGQDLMPKLLRRCDRRRTGSIGAVAGLKRLNKALLQQRCELRRMHSWPSGKPRFVSDVCGVCARPMAEAMQDYPVPAPDAPSSKTDGGDHEARS
jgi:hypothetical protein